MMKLAKNIFSRIQLSLFLLVCMSGVFFLLARQVRQSVDIRRNLASKASDFLDERSAGQGSAILFSSRIADMNRINDFFIAGGEPIPFVENLERIATTTGVHVTFSVDEPQSADRNLLFRVTVAGSEKNVLRYLEILEHLPYLAHMEDVTFQRASSGSTGAGSGTGKSSANANAMVKIRVQTR